MFDSEQDMSKKFESFLKENFGNTYLKEFPGLFGIPDYVFYNKQKKEVVIISFELKLKDWRRAAIQAFRYNNFSNVSYVVLPEETAKVAETNIELFKKYNIGLASFDEGCAFTILYKPEVITPYSLLLNKKIIDSVKSCKKRTRNFSSLV